MSAPKPSHRANAQGWFVFALSTLACAAAAAATVPPPNIVVIMTDDLDTSVFNKSLKLGYLPNIQREFVAKGTSFSPTYVALSMCCPSRTTYFTGQYPHNHGILANAGKHGGFETFVRDGATLPVWLHSAGYRTALMGKYLNGYGSSPRSLGGTYIPPGWDVWKALYSVGQYDYKISLQGVQTFYGHQPADYQTDVLAGFAQAFLLEPQPQPFFLTLTPTAPHFEGRDDGDDNDSGVGSIRPPDRYATTPPLAAMPQESLRSFNEAQMSDKPAWMRDDPLVDPLAQRRGFNEKVAAMRAVDDLVGTVVTTLRSTGREANTVLIFTSDNGYQYGTHRRTRKTDLYDESIQVPMIIRAPGQTVPRTLDVWAMNIDWAPTLLEYAGATPDIALDGRSLLPWVLGSGLPPVRRTMLVEHPVDGGTMTLHPPYRMIRTRDPALTFDMSGLTTLVYAETYTSKGVLTDVELYDMTLDPLQLMSLHLTPGPLRIQQMNALAARLQQLKACVGDACRALDQ